MLKIQIKTFQQLTTDELYAMLQLRSEVFVVEQDCVYQDMDYKDQKALHVLGYKDQRLIAYTRLFKPGDYFDRASIGRVVVLKQERMHHHGRTIMEASMDAVELYFDVREIKISAQEYLLDFYNDLGFRKVGETYLEDGIPHIAMLRD